MLTELTFKLVTAAPFKYEMNKRTESNDGLSEFIQRSKGVSVLRGVYVR